MKITDIAQVRISNEAATLTNNFTNREAVACIILQNSVPLLPTDNKWIGFDEATTLPTSVNVPLQITNFNDKVKKEILEWASTFTAQGGNISQVKFKRIKVTSASDNIVTTISNAVYGTSTEEALEMQIIQLQLLWELGGIADGLVNETSLKAVANALFDETYPINTKVVYVTRTDSPTNGEGFDNLVWIKTGIVPSSTQSLYYESALPMAFFSAIDFSSGAEIKDVEYTAWLGKDLTGATIDEIIPNDSFYNIITDIRLSGNASYRLFVRGETISGLKIRTIYFEIVLSQLCTDALARLTLSKVKFSLTTLGLIYSTLANVLDKFTANGLFDKDYVSEINRVINRNSVNYNVLKIGEVLPYGYRLLTLPVTSEDKKNKTYTGTYLYIAFGNQIRKITLNGLLLGGF